MVFMLVSLVLIIAAGGIGYKIGFADGKYATIKKKNEEKVTQE